MIKSSRHSVLLGLEVPAQNGREIDVDQLVTVIATAVRLVTAVAPAD